MAGEITIALGADHGGFILKEEIKRYLEGKQYKIKDFGTNSIEPCDYPQFGYKAAKAVASGKADYGIVICKTGFGMAIIANKVKGIRSAVCDTVDETKSACQHNACNVLSLAAKRITCESAKEIVQAFLTTAPEGDRHQRRVKQIMGLEKKR